MSATFLKTLSLHVLETLSTLYNESFSHAMVTPVHKGVPNWILQIIGQYLYYQFVVKF